MKPKIKIMILFSKYTQKIINQYTGNTCHLLVHWTWNKGHWQLSVETQRNCKHATSWLQSFKRKNSQHSNLKGSWCQSTLLIMKWWVTSLIDQSVIADKNLTPQQTYSTNKLSPFWHYCSRKTVTTGCDTSTCVKDATDRITVLEYTNTSGTLHGSLLRGAQSHILAVSQLGTSYQSLFMLTQSTNHHRHIFSLVSS